MLLTAHFTQEELSCPCCGRCEMDPEFLRKLETFRVSYGEAFKPNSAYRCPAHNEKVGGVNGSQHVAGRACDVPVEDSEMRWRLVRSAQLLGLTTIIYPTFVHIDGRAGRPLLLIGVHKAV